MAHHFFKTFKQVLHPEKTFWGHPLGLWVVAYAEAWLAFAQYGVLAILVFYMRDFLLTPEHMTHVWGIHPILALTKFLYAPIGVQATAGALMGLFMALLYAMPLLGGLLADRVLGQTRTIFLGMLIACAGYALMGIPTTFVVGMVMALLGTGCCGSLKAQVGAFYHIDDRRRYDAYQIYVFAIQVTTIISPLLCGFVSQFAWWMSFAVACLGMILGIIGYAACFHTLPQESSLSHKTDSNLPLTRTDWKKIILLLGLIGVFTIGALPNQDIMDGYLLWGSQHYSLSLWGYHFSVSSLISLDGFISAVTSILVLWFWRWYEHKRPALHEIDKVIIGSFLSIFGPLFLAAGSWLSPGPHGVSLWWGIAFHTINDIAFAMVYAIGMALFSRVAPARVNTLMLACFMLHVFFSNLIVGKLAALLSQMSDVTFWCIHAGCAAAATLLLLLCSVLFRPLLTPTQETVSPEEPH